MDDDFAEKKRKIRHNQGEVKNLGMGLGTGIGGLVHGIGGGITGMVTAPVKGVQEDGAAGLFKVTEDTMSHVQCTHI